VRRAPYSEKDAAHSGAQGIEAEILLAEPKDWSGKPGFRPLRGRKYAPNIKKFKFFSKNVSKTPYPRPYTGEKNGGPGGPAGKPIFVRRGAIGGNYEFAD
jgi:hypothetical protein